jgi:hypothetical protein
MSSVVRDDSRQLSDQTLTESGPRQGAVKSGDSAGEQPERAADFTRRHHIW